MSTSRGARVVNGIEYKPCRPACMNCRQSLSSAERELGLAFCDQCSTGFMKSRGDVLRPAPLRRRRRWMKILSLIGYGILWVLAFPALFVAGILIGGAA